MVVPNVRDVVGVVPDDPLGMALADVVAVFRRWLHLPDPTPLYLVLAAVAANVADRHDHPVWLMLVGPPGCGKTELLTPLDALPYVHEVSDLSGEAALLSGTPKRERDTNATNGLLHQIGEFGIITFPDFGALLAQKVEKRGPLLAALRNVYDGKYVRTLGVDGGRTLAWSGKVGFVAGVTGTIDRHHAVNAAMGERFVLYRFPVTDGDAQAAAALRHRGREDEMHADLSGAVVAFLDRVNDEGGRRDVLDADDADNTRLIGLAHFACRSRSAVERDRRSREVELVPESEAPARLTLVLARLLGALARVGVPRDEAWRIVADIALDSMPVLRRLVVDDLAVSTGAATTTTAELLAERIDHPYTTVLRALDDLSRHGITEKIKRLGDTTGKAGRPADEWRLTEWALTRIPQRP